MSSFDEVPLCMQHQKSWKPHINPTFKIHIVLKLFLTDIHKLKLLPFYEIRSLPHPCGKYIKLFAIPNPEKASKKQSQICLLSKGKIKEQSHC